VLLTVSPYLTLVYYTTGMANLKTGHYLDMTCSHVIPPAASLMNSC